MEKIAIDDFMKQIPDYFLSERAGNVVAVVQCSITGDEPSNWVIEIRNGECKSEEGLAEDPDVTIKANGKTAVNLLTGKINPMRAFLLGKVKVSGDLNLGMKLVKFFDYPG